MSLDLTALPQRRLGRTERFTTPVGIGGASLNHGYQLPSSDEEAAAALVRAAELGFGYLDTSPHYGESERRIGLALRANPQLRKQFFLASKTGTGPCPLGCHSHRDSADWTYRSVERSLARMQTDFLDLVQIHDPDSLEPALAPHGALEALLDLKQQGVIGAVGLGVRSHDLLLQAVQHGSFDTILTYADFNLLRQTARDRLFGPACVRDVAIILGSPILFGWLTDQAEARLAAGDPLKSVPREELERLAAWCRRKEISLLSLALQYCLRESRIAVVLVGTRTVEEVEAFAEAVLNPLPATIWQELNSELGIS